MNKIITFFFFWMKKNFIKPKTTTKSLQTGANYSEQSGQQLRKNQLRKNKPSPTLSESNQIP
jgi:hypothetical protein